jgi:hypothetical protein
MANNHTTGANVLTAREKELIRQWILFGAKNSGNTPGEALIDQYYDANGVIIGQAGFPGGAPPAPAAADGFQIKLGPYFLSPQGSTTLNEQEWFWKYALEMDIDKEVSRVHTFMDPYSHHLVISQYPSVASATATANEFRSSPTATLNNFIFAFQNTTNVQLPYKTAFRWSKDNVLELNTHCVNYSANVYACEAYINVYTQPMNTATQEMSLMQWSNTAISIPNDNMPHTFSQPFTMQNGNAYVWSMTGITGKYGTGYKIYQRNASGAKGRVFYDASCQQGASSCTTPFYNYRQNPMRHFNTVIPVDMTQGFIHEASYVNNGLSTAQYGTGPNDELMYMSMMFLNDTTGTGIAADYAVLATEQPLAETVQISPSPNPFTNQTVFSLPQPLHNGRFLLYNTLGAAVKEINQINDTAFVLNREGLAPGIYFFRLEDEEGNAYAGKLIVSRAE